MKKYTELRLPGAERELAELWHANRPSHDLTDSVARIDNQLAISPLDLGESRAGDQSIYYEDRLAVLYRVRVVDKIVEVGHICQLP
jgi:hypothetical protein